MKHLPSNNMKKDPATGTLQTIDYVHHEVHDGRHFTFSAYDNDLDTDGVIEYILTTPDTTRWSHIVFTFFGALETLFELYETTTHALGALQTSYNNDRNSSNTAGMTIHANGGTGADGTLIDAVSVGVDDGGGANRVAGGGASRGDQEWILKQNTKYLVRVKSGTDNNNCSLILSWYEHINKA